MPISLVEKRMYGMREATLVEGEKSTDNFQKELLSGLPCGPDAAILFFERGWRRNKSTGVWSHKWEHYLGPQARPQKPVKKKRPRGVEGPNAFEYVYDGDINFCWPDIDHPSIRVHIHFPYEMCVCEYNLHMAEYRVQNATNYDTEIFVSPHQTRLRDLCLSLTGFGDEYTRLMQYRKDEEAKRNNPDHGKQEANKNLLLEAVRILSEAHNMMNASKAST